MDGLLIAQGRRLADLSVVEMLNFTLARLLKDADEEGRRKIDLALEGRLGEHGGEIIEDDSLPASMQGVEAPSWWNSDDNPFGDTHDLGGTDARFHSVG